MVRYENRCCDCATDNYTCVGLTCKNRKVKVYECDECKEEVPYGQLFYFENRELCMDCIEHSLEVVD